METRFRGLLALVLLLVPPAVAQAQFNFTTNNGAITITRYTGPGGAVIVPSMTNGWPVTAIGLQAFHSCPGLSSVSIPDSVLTIAWRAFSSCASLTNVTIGNGVTNISSPALSWCPNLTAITVDTNNPAYSSLDGVLFNRSQTTLVEYPEGNTGAYTIPNSVTSIGPSAFAYVAALTSVTIPNSVTSIGGSAFYGCTNLSNVVIGTSVAIIGAYTFEDCTSLTNVTIPSSVATLGAYTFEDCTSLTNVTIPNSVTNIGEGAFKSCAGLTSVTIPDSLLSIGADTFSYCTSLTNVRISNSVTNIGEGAFASCAGLTSVTIPDSVVSIGALAFHDCSSLTNATIGKGLTNIGAPAFPYCPNLTAITVDTNNPAYSSLAGVLFNKGQTTLVEYPGGKAGAYAIPNSVTNIEFEAFFGCNGLTSVTIGNSVISIGAEAFHYCPSLTSITIGSSLINLGGNAFDYCYSLTGAYFQGDAPSLDFYGQFMFYGANNATVYYLPGTTGWDTYFGGRPTARWFLPNPLILDNSLSFGVRTNRFGFIISWATNIPVVVEACADLGHPIWSPVGTNTLTGGWSYFSDPQWANYPARLYRLHSL